MSDSVEKFLQDFYDKHYLEATIETDLTEEEFADIQLHTQESRRVRIGVIIKKDDKYEAYSYDNFNTDSLLSQSLGMFNHYKKVHSIIAYDGDITINLKPMGTFEETKTILITWQDFGGHI